MSDHSRVIDLHAHILPGVDDGPPTMHDALDLARAAVEAGTITLAATSHVNEMSELSAAAVAAGVEELRAELQRHEIPLDVRTGGEIGLSWVPRLDNAELRGLALGGGPYLLLECPLFGDARALEPTVRDLQRRGHSILLAHPERSPALQHEPERLAELIASGALVQVTAGALTGDFGEVPRRMAHDLLRDGLAHVVASDAHDVSLRPPGVGADVPRWATEEIPAAILAGEPPAQLASLTTAMTAPARTSTTIASCIQIHKRGTPAKH